MTSISQLNHYRQNSLPKLRNALEMAWILRSVSIAVVFCFFKKPTVLHFLLYCALIGFDMICLPFLPSLTWLPRVTEVTQTLGLVSAWLAQIWKNAKHSESLLHSEITICVRWHSCVWKERYQKSTVELREAPGIVLPQGSSSAFPTQVCCFIPLLCTFISFHRLMTPSDKIQASCYDSLYVYFILIVFYFVLHLSLFNGPSF